MGTKKAATKTKKHNEADLGKHDEKNWYKKHDFYVQKRRENASMRLYNKYLGVEWKVQVKLFYTGRVALTVQPQAQAGT